MQLRSLIVKKWKLELDLREFKSFFQNPLKQYFSTSNLEMHTKISKVNLITIYPTESNHLRSLDTVLENEFLALSLVRMLLM